MAEKLAWDFRNDLVAASDYARRVANCYRASGQPGDAAEYDLARESLENEIARMKASAIAESFWK